MKNKLLLASMAMLLFGAPRATAQPTAIPPALPDNFWYAGCNNALAGGYISGLNTAMINYGSIPFGQGSLIVSAYEGNGTAGGVVFTDAGNPLSTIHIPYCTAPVPPAPWPYITSPDIIVGNDLGNPLGGYKVAVAYVDAFTAAPTVDFYQVTYTGVGTFVVAAAGTMVFGVPGVPSKSIHLDIVAEYNNQVPTGLPWCDNFIVTWDDGGGSWAELQSLNAPLLPAPIALGLAPGAMLLPFQPDVAAIQRAKTWPCPGGVCIPEIVGCFVTNEGNQLAYQEYNFTAGVFTPPVALVMLAGAPNRPRIDAPDDLNTNNPAIPLYAYVKVVTEDYTAAGFVLSVAYDNMSWFAPLNDGGFLPVAGGPGSGPYSPTVAYGGAGGAQYQVAHFTDAIAGAGTPFTNVWMEPLNAWAPASGLAPDITCGTFPLQFFYRVNTTMPTFSNGVYLESISTPCNFPIGATLIAWADNFSIVPPAVVPAPNVMYKISGFGCPGGYGFRQANGGSNAAAVPVAWKLYPNPATTELAIEAPDATTYRVTDVLGRTLLSGTLTQGKQTIGINALRPGNYIFTAQNNDGSKEHMSFVKQ